MNDGARTSNEEESNDETGRELNVARSFGHSIFITEPLLMICHSSFSQTPQCL
jgi:hypothetical protein